MHEDHETRTESTEDTVLVVLDGEHPERTVRAAMQDRDPAETTFHLLSVVPTQAYEERRRSFVDAGVPREYTIGQAKENARQVAQRVGRAFFGPETAGFRSTGAIGRPHERVRSLVREHGFTTIYVPERGRSLLQRFLAGGSLARTLTHVLPDGVTVETVDVVGGRTTGEAGTDGIFDAGGSVGQSS